MGDGGPTCFSSIPFAREESLQRPPAREFGLGPCSRGVSSCSGFGVGCAELLISLHFSCVREESWSVGLIFRFLSSLSFRAFGCALQTTHAGGRSRRG